MPERDHMNILVVCDLRIWAEHYRWTRKSADRYVHISPSSPASHAMSLEPDRVIFHGCCRDRVRPDLLEQIEMRLHRTGGAMVLEEAL